MCVYLSFRYCMGQPSKDCLCCQHTLACENILACGHKVYQLPVQGKYLKFGGRVQIVCVRLYKKNEKIAGIIIKWMLV